MRGDSRRNGLTARRTAVIAAVSLLAVFVAGSASAQRESRTLAGPVAARADSLAAAAADTSFAMADTLAGTLADTLIAASADTLALAAADSLADPVADLITGPDLWDTGASPAAAVLMSPLFPGWGQLYTENSWRAALAYGSQMWFWSRMLTRDRRAVRAREFAATFDEDEYGRTAYNAIAEENWELMRDYAWWSGAAMLIIALDSYVGAHLFHFDDDPVPVPNRWDDIFDPPGGEMPGSTGSPTVVVACWGTRF